MGQELAGVYGNEHLAAGYAFDRPPVHEHIVRRFRPDRLARRALDIGCGAGLSTVALMDVAETVFGLEPMLNMLTYRDAVAPEARFIVGRAETLPFAAESFDLITAAGALNYVDLSQFMPEAERVLSPGASWLSMTSAKAAGYEAMMRWRAGSAPSKTAIHRHRVRRGDRSKGVDREHIRI